MKIRAIEIFRTQREWACEVTFSEQTARQCSHEEITVLSGGRWILTALWNGLRAAKRKANEVRATPEQLKERGWTQ